MKKLFFFVCVVAVMAFTGMAMAESEPFQLSLTPDVAVHDKSTRIEGVTLNIWGENPQSALALGFVNGSTGDSTGLSWGFLINYADSYKGVQWAPVNYTKFNFMGWQSGIVNYTEGSTKGLQTGLVNYAGHLTGLQLGFVNYAERATSAVQIGLINIIPENEWFTGLPEALAPGMVIVNWRFSTTLFGT